MKPSSRVQCYRWILVGRSLIRLFYAKNRQSRPETFQMASGPFEEFMKKIISRDTKLPFGRSSQKSQRIISACQAFRTSPGILHIGEISERRLVHPLMMCFEMINLII